MGVLEDIDRRIDALVERYVQNVSAHERGVRGGGRTNVRAYRRSVDGDGPSPAAKLAGAKRNTARLGALDVMFAPGKPLPDHRFDPSAKQAGGFKVGDTVTLPLAGEHGGKSGEVVGLWAKGFRNAGMDGAVVRMHNQNLGPDRAHHGMRAFEDVTVPAAHLAKGGDRLPLTHKQRASTHPELRSVLHDAQEQAKRASGADTARSIRYAPIKARPIPKLESVPAAALVPPPSPRRRSDARARHERATHGNLNRKAAAMRESDVDALFKAAMQHVSSRQRSRPTDAPEAATPFEAVRESARIAALRELQKPRK